jgi:hypothetical protein
LLLKLLLIVLLWLLVGSVGYKSVQTGGPSKSSVERESLDASSLSKGNMISGALYSDVLSLHEGVSGGVDGTIYSK